MRGETIRRAGGRWLLVVATALAALAFMAIHAPGAHAARGMDLGLYDGEFNVDDPTIRLPAFNRAKQADANSVLIYVTWRSVAPTSPPVGFNATNPADPAYNWSSTDAAVQDATARGFKI